MIILLVLLSLLGGGIILLVTSLDVSVSVAAVNGDWVGGLALIAAAIILYMILLFRFEG